jgi:hypothetical protein
VPRIARVLGRVGQRDDRMAVLPGVERELVAAQLSLRPALVEGVAQDVPALRDLVHAVEEVAHRVASW